MIFKWQIILAVMASQIHKEQEDVIGFLLAEIKVLQEKLNEELGGKRLLLTDDQRRLLAVKGKILSRKLLKKFSKIFTPDTIFRWHAKLIAMKYDSSSQERKCRLPDREEITSLILKMVKENHSWGYKRIQGELKSLGFKVCKSTIRRILKEHGIEPAPDRGMSWAEFLRIHSGMICAADFFTIEIWTPIGLTRYHVLFVMDLATRIVEIAGIVHRPNEDWMKQIARNLTDAFDGFLLDKKYLILDRDPLYTDCFKDLLKPTEVITLPAKSPNLNAFAERFVKSIKNESLNNMIIFGEEALRKATFSYVEHYNKERPHQGLKNEPLMPLDFPKTGEIHCKERLGGLLKHYYRKAA